ncbi:MAG: HNH endonuclease [Gemmatimonadetes bacterium]|nr:HNH endonuclease [Gemmatimonadota bacterium]
MYCGEQFSDRELTVDHVQPRAKHGDMSVGNLVTACSPCNVRKGSAPAWRYLESRPVEREHFLRCALHIWPRHRQAVIEAGE